ncbi:MAG: hypothetical protein HY718_10450 [Planctomycetes bacterium]|nr:hypothetical protein [Planctomycetota bacterium]
MYYRRLRKPSKPTIFALLMAASAVLILLPREFLGSARQMTQLVALPQYGVSRLAQGVSRSAAELRLETVPAREHDELTRSKQALENETIALRQQILQLRTTVDELQQLRGRSRFPANGRLIPARVVGWDAVPGRDSMVLLKGRSPAVRQGDWVTSRLAVQAGGNDGIREDLWVLARETLIGWVEFTSPYVSRVVLLSDRYANRAWRVYVVAVGRDKEDEFVCERGEPIVFALEGLGDGKMRIPDVDARLVTSGRIREGDVVTSDGQDPRLPLAMVIGEIVKLQQVKKQPLLYHAIVKHRCDPKDIAEVFVVDVPH